MKTLEKQTDIIDTVKEFPGIDQKAISKITGFSTSTVSRHCKSLVNEEYLVRVGRKYYTGQRFIDFKKQYIGI